MATSRSSQSSLPFPFRLPLRLPIVGLLALLFTGVAARTEEPRADRSAIPASVLPEEPGDGEFVRYDDRDPDRQRLETGVVRYVRGDRIVDLVGAVHLADPGYFDALNAQLAQYDVVLYEMVGGEFATRADRAEQVDPEIAQVQVAHGLIHRILGMEYQTEGIDYDRPNFVHADVDWAQYEALMTARDQSLATLFQRALAMARDGKGPAILTDEEAADRALQGLMSGLSTGNTATLKRSLAPFLGEAESFINEIEGDDGTVLVTERNKVVMAVLERELGRGHRNLAIFYGAGHFVDLERRLLATGFERQTGVWMTAWDITEPAPGERVNLWRELLGDPAILQGLMSNLQEILQGWQGGALPEAMPGR